jgi:hypothetical protein
MTMIEDTAQENSRTRRAIAPVGRAEGHAAATGDTMRASGWAEAGAGTPAGRPAVPRLALCMAGLIVVAGIGGFMLLPKAAKPQPAGVADEARESGSDAIGSAGAPDKLAERLPQSEELAAPGEPDRNAQQPSEEGIVTGSTPAAQPGEGTVAAPATGQPTEHPGNDGETQGDGTATTQASADATPADTTPADTVAPAWDTTSEQPPPADTAASPPPAGATASGTDQAKAPVATRTARAISDVNMRAGPSNTQAVLARVPVGKPIEVISCQQWCEVIFAGHRGWVYKAFIAASPTPDGR